MFIQWVEKKVFLSATVPSVDAKQHHARPIRRCASFLHPRDVVVVDPPFHVTIPIVVAQTDVNNFVALQRKLAM